VAGALPAAVFQHERNYPMPAFNRFLAGLLLTGFVLTGCVSAADAGSSAATSASAHLFMAALQQWQQEQEREGQSGSAALIFDKVMWAFRCAFFRDGRDIARRGVQYELAEVLGVDIDATEKRIHEGTAFASLAGDYQDADKMRIEGSPSVVLNDGRQKLYGNVGFPIIEANI
jgi:predicted DsbA family dithiol-disulfide isomerase